MKIRLHIVDRMILVIKTDLKIPLLLLLLAKPIRNTLVVLDRSRICTNGRAQPARWLSWVGVLAFFLLAPTLIGTAQNVPAPNTNGFAAYVMNKIDNQHRRNTSHGIMEMIIKTKYWSRTLSMESWSLGKDYSLVRILEPKMERGTATLKAKSDLFTYLSKTGRTVKISSATMGGSWMGSHFTNDDLVKHTRLARDYIVKSTSTDVVAGIEVHRFSLVPRPNLPIVWGKIVVTVRQSDLEPLSQLFYDEAGNKVRILKFSEHKNVAGEAMPFNMTMMPLDGSGEYTTLRWKKIEFGVTLDKQFFSVQRLRSL